MKNFFIAIGILCTGIPALSAPIACKSSAGVIKIDGSKFLAGATSGLADGCSNPYQCMPSFPIKAAVVNLNTILSPAATNLPTGNAAGNIRCASDSAVYPENLIEVYDSSGKQDVISFSSSDECIAALSKIQSGLVAKIGFAANPSDKGWEFGIAGLCE